MPSVDKGETIFGILRLPDHMNVSEVDSSKMSVSKGSNAWLFQPNCASFRLHEGVACRLKKKSVLIISGTDIIAIVSMILIEYTMCNQ